MVELKRALTLAPNSDEGYRRLGDVYLATGKEDDAIQAYQQAIDANPYYWLNYNRMGTVVLPARSERESTGRLPARDGVGAGVDAWIRQPRSGLFSGREVE